MGYFSKLYLICRRLGLLFLGIPADGTHCGSDSGSDGNSDGDTSAGVIDYCSDDDTDGNAHPQSEFHLAVIEFFLIWFCVLIWHGDLVISSARHRMTRLSVGFRFHRRWTTKSLAAVLLP